MTSCHHVLRLLTIVLAGLVSTASLAQTYPTRPIRLVVTSAAGAGVTDIMARLVAQPLSVALGQQIVIDNRPGAGSILATEIVANAPADGYTLLMTNVSFVVAQYLYAKMPYDPVRDFVPVSMVNSAPLMLVVHPTVAATSVAALIADAKARPGAIYYASGGVGSTPHLSAELFKALAGIDIVHVPYKSGPPALNDLLAGQVAFMIENVPGTMPFVRDGKLRALAITSRQRSPLALDLPTMQEAGVPGYEMIGWNGMVAVRDTPPAIVARVSAELAKILRGPEMAKQMTALGAEPVGNSPTEFAAFLATERARWGKLIPEAGIRAE